MSAEPTRRIMPRPVMPRRVLLSAAGAGALLLAGCRGIAALGPLPELAADVRTLDEAVAAEELMVARYQAAVPILSHNARLAATVAGLLTEHRAHLVQLRARLVLPPRLATASPRPSPTPPALPTEHRKILAELARAEQSAADRLARQLLDVPPSLAQLMASIGASEAMHAVVLTATRPSR